MNKKFLGKTFAFMLAVPVLAGSAAYADEVQMPQETAATPMPASVPHKGQTMAQVTKLYGQPQTEHPAVGGDTPKHPPITRWDYAGFSVFFENNHVVDAVIPGHPSEVYHEDKLQQPQ